MILIVFHFWASFWFCLLWFWSKGISPEHKRKDPLKCLLSSALHTLAEGKGIMPLLPLSVARLFQEQSLSLECLDHVVFNHCDPK